MVLVEQVASKRSLKIINSFRPPLGTGHRHYSTLTPVSVPTGRAQHGASIVMHPLG